VKKLTIDDIQVPEGMAEALENEGIRIGAHLSHRDDRRKRMLAAALLWLAENPIVPTFEQTTHLYGFKGQYDKSGFEGHRDPDMASAMVEWQRRMFLKPKPEVTLSGEWPESTCVECGQKMELGRMRKCPEGGEMGSGMCTHHVPNAIRYALELGKKAVR